MFPYILAEVHSWIWTSQVLYLTCEVKHKHSWDSCFLLFHSRVCLQRRLKKQNKWCFFRGHWFVLALNHRLWCGHALTPTGPTGLVLEAEHFSGIFLLSGFGSWMEMSLQTVQPYFMSWLLFCFTFFMQTNVCNFCTNISKITLGLTVFVPPQTGLHFSDRWKTKKTYAPHFSWHHFFIHSQGAENSHSTGAQQVMLFLSRFFPAFVDFLQIEKQKQPIIESLSLCQVCWIIVIYQNKSVCLQYFWS